MDPFALIIFSGVAVIVVAVALVGRYYPGSGLNEIGMRSARQISEQREALEAEDLDQMIAARNARRRARGESETSAADLELEVARELRAQEQRRQEYVADQQRAKEKDLANEELEQMLGAINARRRARGQPPRTRQDAQREFGSD